MPSSFGKLLAAAPAASFTCAAASVACIKQFRPDMVLSDIYSPNRDGFELLRDIRELGPVICGSEHWARRSDRRPFELGMGANNGVAPGAEGPVPDAQYG